MQAVHIPQKHRGSDSPIGQSARVFCKHPYLLEGTTFCEESGSKRDTPWHCHGGERITPLKGSILNCHHRAGQLDNSEGVTVAPRMSLDGVKACFYLHMTKTSKGEKSFSREDACFICRNPNGLGEVFIHFTINLLLRAHSSQAFLNYLLQGASTHNQRCPGRSVWVATRPNSLPTFPNDGKC